MQANDVNRKSTRCAIYTRVSTDMQAEVEFNSCEAQEARVRSFIESQEGFKVFKVYTDSGYSGANLDRPALREMLRDIRNGLLDMVISYKIDRLTRSPRDFYELIEHFETHHAGFISVTERFDTSTPAGRLLRNIMLTFAQFERELVSERVKDKVIQRAKKGLYTGGVPPFGYKAENGKLVLDPPRDEVARMVFDAYVKKRSLSDIVRLLEERKITSRKGSPLTDSFVFHVLRNPVYTGKIVHKDNVYPGQHPAIISEELFNHVQKLIQDQPRGKADPVPAIPFAGLIRCQECGSVMYSSFSDKINKSGPKRYHYYRCTQVNHKGWSHCSIKEINAERLHDKIYKNVLRISLDPDYLSSVVRHIREDQTRREPKGGSEPRPMDEDLTPKNLSKSLEEFLSICARRTGMERILAIRRRIRQIKYSKKAISVEFFYGRPPVGKCLSETSPSAAALLAAPPVCPPARKIEKPNRCFRLGSSAPAGSEKNGAEGRN